jgi:hypothetical protein
VFSLKWVELPVKGFELGANLPKGAKGSADTLQVMHGTHLRLEMTVSTTPLQETSILNQ